MTSNFKLFRVEKNECKKVRLRSGSPWLSIIGTFTIRKRSYWKLWRIPSRHVMRLCWNRGILEFICPAFHVATANWANIYSARIAMHRNLYSSNANSSSMTRVKRMTNTLLPSKFASCCTTKKSSHGLAILTSLWSLTSSLRSYKLMEEKFRRSRSSRSPGKTFKMFGKLTNRRFDYDTHLSGLRDHRRSQGPFYSGKHTQRNLLFKFMNPQSLYR